MGQYDFRWRKLAMRIRGERPLCEDCDKKGRTTPNEEVHHIVPVSINPKLRLVVSNLVALCKECHDKRHGGSGHRWIS